ncbi:MAG: hypothetical protein D6807_05250 [Alphaproteobacteria bacterium]|nr:MAG: hypothetical protein D6807_05250 [Alphaproteobacteria bacterium]
MLRLSFLFALSAQILFALATAAAAAPIVVDVNRYMGGSVLSPSLDIDGNDDPFTFTGYDLTFATTTKDVFGALLKDVDRYARGIGSNEVSLGGPLAPDTLIDGTLAFGHENHIFHRRFGQTLHCTFLPGQPCELVPFDSVDGSWRAKDDFSTIRGFLGFRLAAGGDWRYGWIDLTSERKGALFVHRFGYESIIGRGIRAGAVAAPDPVPAPPALALFAVGALGIAAARRRARRR